MARGERFRSSFWRLRASTRVVMVGLVALVLVGVVAATSGAVGSEGAVTASADPGWLYNVLAAGFLVVAVAVAALFLVYGGPTFLAAHSKDKQPPSATRGAMVTVGVAICYGLAVVLLNIAGSSSSKRAHRRVTVATLGSANRGNRSGGGSVLDWSRVGPIVAVALGLGAAVWWFVTWRRRRSRIPIEVRPDVVWEAAAESLDAVLAEPDPRRAVVLAYQRMEAALGAVGIVREVWETPFEYLDRVFAELGAPTAVAATLTKLYEHAKFSHHPVTTDMRDVAVSALVELVGELREVA